MIGNSNNSKIACLALAALSLAGCNKEFGDYFRAQPQQPLTEASGTPTPAPTVTSTPGPTNPQEFTVGATQTQAKVDLLMLIDRSGSMAAKITEVRNKISFIANSPLLQSANLRVAIEPFGESSTAYYKQGSANNLVLWQHLPSAGGLNKHNTLNSMLLSYGEIYPASTSSQQLRLLNPTTEMATIQSRIASINPSPNAAAESENGICSTALAYQSVATGGLVGRVRAGDAFRSDADALVVVIVSDEKSEPTYCPLQLAPHTQVPQSCYCTTQGNCTAYTTVTYTCGTDINPNQQCSYQSCSSWNPAPSSVQMPSCPAQCTAPATPATSGGYAYMNHVGSPNGGGAAAYLASVQTSIQQFRLAQSPNRGLMVNFIGYTGGACSPPPANTYQSVGTGYMEMAAATGGVSRCINDDFGPAFQNIAQQISQTNLVYGPLSFPSAVASVTRRRAGATVTLTRNTDYVISGSNVQLTASSVQSGDVIRVNY